MISQKIAAELGISNAQVNATLALFAEDCTVPFIARYRKERTGSLDEVQIRAIRDRHEYLVDLEDSRSKYLAVVRAQASQDAALAQRLPALEKSFLACETKQALDDLYLPFRPKRRSRAVIAREAGFGPLAQRLFGEFVENPESCAKSWCEENAKVLEEAMKGAADILAEDISEDAETRQWLRTQLREHAHFFSERVVNLEEITDKKLLAKARKYDLYAKHHEALKTIPAHRVLAMRRGESEKILRTQIIFDEESFIQELTRRQHRDFFSPSQAALFASIVSDSFQRLLGPSIISELRVELKKQAEGEAIRVFAGNLGKLLLLPPLPPQVVMGIDPGIRTGCKLAVVDGTGKYLTSHTIHPHLDQPEHEKTKIAFDVLGSIADAREVNFIAIGNGTGGREMGKLVAEWLKTTNRTHIKRVFVNEAGASVYSTDEIAREEFPDLDPTIRSAVSIARRLQDPLAELVKIDPRSIGVGQYQHDVSPQHLQKRLDEVVESCVNQVGVNLNTASHALLRYVSGIGPSLAKNIVGYRNERGVFKDRYQLLEVSGFGPKSFTLCAGFLRIPGAEHPLDNSAVHPERYKLVEKICSDARASLEDIVGNRAKVEQLALENYVSDDVGLPTLQDIASELIKPGRDPREEGTHVVYSSDVADISDLEEGMELSGTVTNVTDFGAFVDIGVHQDGLIHKSELTHDFVPDPTKVIAVGEVVKVKVTQVDKERRRISLSRRACLPAPERPEPKPRRAHEQPRQQHETRSSQPRRNEQHGAKPRKEKAPAKTFTMDDLYAKFGKK